MKLGFTGTRNGMTLQQRVAFNRVLFDLVPDELHHGDCVGSDMDAHVRWRDYFQNGRAGSRPIIIHPPTNPKLRSYAEGDVILQPLPYIKRNEAIVDACDHLVATPKEDEEVVRSGTWATVRYARKQGKKVTVIYPNGLVVEEIPSKIRHDHPDGPLMDIPHICAVFSNSEKFSGRVVQFVGLPGWYRLDGSRYEEYKRLKFSVRQKNFERLIGPPYPTKEAAGWVPLDAYQCIKARVQAFDPHLLLHFVREYERQVQGGRDQTTAIVLALNKEIVPAICSAMRDASNPYAASNTREKALRLIALAWEQLPAAATIAVSMFQ